MTTAMGATMPSPEEAIVQGKAARESVPRTAHADLADRPASFDPVKILTDQGHGRLEDLLPVRYARMAADEFSFLRGAAAVMAADIALGPSSDLTVQLCGDAHLSNFGVFFSPERRLVFDINDFDETHPGPFEWDVKRLAASIAVAGDSLNLSKGQQERAVFAAVSSYRDVDAALRDGHDARRLVRAPRARIDPRAVGVVPVRRGAAAHAQHDRQGSVQGRAQGVHEARDRDRERSGDQVGPAAPGAGVGALVGRQHLDLRVLG